MITTFPKHNPYWHEYILFCKSNYMANLPVSRQSWTVQKNLQYYKAWQQGQSKKFSNVTFKT